jgi:diguanylate cyclase (GGDEF)-like protein
VLRIVTSRMNLLLRGNDTVARLGGDEFVLLLGELESRDDAVQLLHRLLQDIGLPIGVQGASTTVTASIGVTFYPTDQSLPAQLLKHADEAMYAAKNSGKSRYHFFC